MKHASHLPRNFVMQSYLHCRSTSTLTWYRQRRTIAVLLSTVVIGLTVAITARSEPLLAFGLGLMAPGAGFGASAFVGADILGPTIAVGTAMAVFLVALVLWFGTGNILAPLLVWIGGAGVAALVANDHATPSINVAHLAAVAAIMPAAFMFALMAARGGKPSRALISASALVAPPRLAELDMRALQLQRLLLDRALQPVDQFDGFEWRDQFQTAAVRYQINFLSYALSLSQAHVMPAFSGYMLEAQRRLLAKQSDRRMWRYWLLESLWGHLRWSTNPVSRDNIMYSGFVAAQIAYAEAAGGQAIAQGQHLDLRVGKHRYGYDFSALVARLVEQYQASPWGLLACEPNWIYPLCNLITATAIRTADARSGCSDWAAIAPKFRDSLLHEFMTRDGRMVPFRSSITGIAMPMLGGIVMQAFPCLFLNALFPDLAERQWNHVRASLGQGRWERAFWPIDVGNYGFSRASSLAASAAAAVEMGDGDSAAAMLEMLDQQCPYTIVDGVRHRPRASLWAHALEFAALCNHQNGLADLVAGKADARKGPHLAEAPYPAVLVAQAVEESGSLSLILHPGGLESLQLIRFAGLQPERHYRVEGPNPGFIRASAIGEASLAVNLVGRTPLAITPLS